MVEHCVVQRLQHEPNGVCGGVDDPRGRPACGRIAWTTRVDPFRPKLHNSPVTKRRAHTKPLPAQRARLRNHSPRAEPLTQNLVTAHTQGDAHVERVFDAAAGQPHHLCGKQDRCGRPARTNLPIGRGWPRLEAALSLIWHWRGVLEGELFLNIADHPVAQREHLG